ncbi:MAG TPA: hypothetical protein VFF06_33560 [Polyangia bacterium]|nr:hypothetical protein [Polyangia bacterium]
MTKALTKQQKFAISSWVNDQFESGGPEQIKKTPKNIAKFPHWKSDPNSGITGTVYLDKWIVFYSAVVAPKVTHWWNLGPLPANLRS